MSRLFWGAYLPARRLIPSATGVVQHVADADHPFGRDGSVEDEILARCHRGRDRPVPERDVPFHADVAQDGVLRARVDLDAAREVVEEHVVGDELRSRLVVDVGAVIEVLVRAVVVHDAPVQLRVHRRRPEAHALRPRVVDDEVDEPPVVGIGLNAVCGRRGLHHLEAPERQVRAVGPQGPVDGGAFPGHLTEHDPPPGSALERGAKRAAVGPAAEPHRISRVDPPVRSGQRRRQIPRMLVRAGPGGVAGRGHDVSAIGRGRRPMP